MCNTPGPIVLNTIGVTSLIVAGVALSLLALSRRRPRLAIGVAAIIIGANITTQLLKTELLDRPDLLQRPRAAITPSFPSGHATVAMSLALGFVLVVPARFRVMAGVIGIGYAVLIGAGTLTSGWHRPSDVIAAYFVTTTWVAFIAAWIIAWRGTQQARRPWRPMILGRLLSSPRLLFGGAGLLIVALLISGTVLLVLNGRELTAIEVGPSYLGAVAAIARHSPHHPGHSPLDAPRRAARPTACSLGTRDLLTVTAGRGGEYRGLLHVWLTVVVTDHAASSLSSRHGGGVKASS